MSSVLLGPDSRPIRTEVDDTDTVQVVRTESKQVFTSLVVDGKDYDPDAEFYETDDLGANPFDFMADKTPDGKAFEVRAQLFEINASGDSFRIQSYADKAQLREAIKTSSGRWGELGTLRVPAPTKLREAEGGTREQCIDRDANKILLDGLQKLREADDFAGGTYDDGGGYGRSGGSGFSRSTYGDGYDAQREFLPMMTGPYAKQLYQAQYLDMHRKAFEAYNHNPVAKRLVNGLADFVLGRGIDHQSTNSDVNEVWSEFTERTGFYDRLWNIFKDGLWAGEICMEFYDNDPESGRTDFRMVDPSSIREIATDPNDMQKIYYYHQEFQQPMQQYTDKTVPPSVYVIRQIPAKNILHIKFNCSEYEKRGRSYLFPVLGWLKRLKDLANARVIKGQLEAAFVWDVEVASGDTDVNKVALNLPDPYKAGSTFVHNAGVKLTPQSSNLKANDQQPDIEMLMNMIALGGGQPKELLGITSRGGGKSGALLASEPGTKNFEANQIFLESRLVHAVANRVIQTAVKGKLLDLDAIMRDARSVTRIARQQQAGEDNRDQAEQTLADRKDEMQAQQEKQQQDAADNAIAQAKEIAKGAAKNGQKQNVKESLREVKNDKTDSENAPLTPQQTKRIETIKSTGKFSKEFLEFMFPAIAQEDRSAKLKDLALSEAMEWLPKETTATMAAKELNITTYNFQEAQSQIREEADQGMSIAHVYGQDNKHVPDTVLAQDVQERDQATTPAPQTFTNVPVPPAVNGMKTVPSGGPGAPGGVGDKPNSGSSKTNKFSAPEPNDTDPTAKSHGHSAAANSPFTSEGKAKIIAKARESIRMQMRQTLLRESLGGFFDMRSNLPSFLLADKIKITSNEQN